MNKYLALLIFLVYSQLSMAESIHENKSWNEIFAQESVDGVFVLCKSRKNDCITNNKERALSGFMPASTFKIANALIALETGVVKSEHQVFKWGGEPRDMKQWEKDFTLRGAMQASAVPVFQQFAREIGEKRMKSYLGKFAYGNSNIDGGIDRFWLEGGLRISAINQVSFLESLYENKLPISECNQLIVKDALISEATPDYLIRSKTGYTGIKGKVQPGIAWWVGWVEKGTEVYFFAFNMNIENESKLPARKSIPTKIMQSEGVLNSS